MELGTGDCFRVRRLRGQVGLGLLKSGSKFAKCSVLISSAFGDYERYVVVLFAWAEPPNFINNRSKQGL
jgi:hypothetical protein